MCCSRIKVIYCVQTFLSELVRKLYSNRCLIAVDHFMCSIWFYNSSFYHSFNTLLRFLFLSFIKSQYNCIPDGFSDARIELHRVIPILSHLSYWGTEVWFLKRNDWFYAPFWRRTRQMSMRDMWRFPPHKNTSQSIFRRGVSKSFGRGSAYLQKGKAMHQYQIRRWGVLSCGGSSYPRFFGTLSSWRERVPMNGTEEIGCCGAILYLSCVQNCYTWCAPQVVSYRFYP